MNNAVIQRAIGEWRQRLCVCVRAKANILSMCCKNNANYYMFDNFVETITTIVFVAIQSFIQMQGGPKK